MLIWLEVDAQIKDKEATISWKTAEESDLDVYTVLHSLNGQTWNSIGRVPVKSGGSNNYEFLQTNPAESKNYYRIMAREHTGDVNLSRVLTVRPVAHNELSVYPNPVNKPQNGTLRVEKPCVIQIWKSNGMLISEAVYSAGTHIISTTDLLPGIYYINNSEKVIQWIIQ